MYWTMGQLFSVFDRKNLDTYCFQHMRTRGHNGKSSERVNCFLSPFFFTHFACGCPLIISVANRTLQYPQRRNCFPL